MALEDFASPSDWVKDLDKRWPERLEIKSQVLEVLTSHLTALPHTPRILELGIGDGELLSTLHTRFPKAHIEAVDIKPILLDFVRQRLKAPATVTFTVQDLSLDDRPGVGSGFDAVYSLQSFHDLGGLAALEATYTQCFSRLASHGLLVNADFVEPMPQDDPKNPRRFPADTHIELLTRLGFTDAKLVKKVNSLGCLAASKTN